MQVYPSQGVESAGGAVPGRHDWTPRKTQDPTNDEQTVDKLFLALQSTTFKVLRRLGFNGNGLRTVSDADVY
jgi:hypothetical protein